ncbi:hypothetical protein [Prevotella pectinovora]|uniref:hypothetical protein n=1 Tax=Prevotella pectinovora TaxID=1602169 RepID=UPI002FD95D59
MSSSATGVGMPICFLGAILLILTQKSSQKFGDVLGIMVLDLLLPKHGVHKDTARYVLSYSKPFELLSKINVDFLPKSENQATCVSFLSLNIHKSVIFLPITSEIHFCVKVFLSHVITFALRKIHNIKSYEKENDYYSLVHLGNDSDDGTEYHGKSSGCQR